MSYHPPKITELDFISKIRNLYSLQVPAHITGIGDDCAVIPQNENQVLLVTTDMLNEHVHFIRSDVPPDCLGHKSLAVSISDIAAMGGIPKYAFLSLAVSPDIEFTWLEEFLKGFHNLAKKESIYLLGGDTTGSSDHLSINVTLLGEMDKQFIKRRSGATPGSIICVTGFLGDSAAGFKIISERIARTSASKALIQRHYQPRPQIQEGHWFSQFSAVQAMMDISDGLRSDIQKIMTESNCGAEIQIENLPASAELLEVSEQFGFDPLPLMTSGGEDYCLLVILDAQKEVMIRQEFKERFNRPLYPIGVIKTAEDGLNFIKNNEKCKIEDLTYLHFSALKVE